MSAFVIAGMRVRSGTRKDLKIRISEHYTATPVFIPVSVIHGARSGPVLFLTAAVHGDEINGVEMIRRLRAELDPATLRGTLVLVLIANPISFAAMKRDLPDGRDLNRFFPGRDRGSMASQIAEAIFTKIVRISDFGIDLHTAASGRTNLPHVRADMGSPVLRRLAVSFGCEVVFDIPGEEGTLRRSSTSIGVPVLVYETGEPLKFQERLIRRGLEGIHNVLFELKMLEGERISPAFQIVASEHKWLRAEQGGILNVGVRPGDILEKGATVAVNTKPFGTEIGRMLAPRSGLVVGVTTVPMVLPGSAVCHLVSLGPRLPVLRRLLERQPLVFE
jgi:predicted deacylase